MDAVVSQFLNTGTAVIAVSVVILMFFTKKIAIKLRPDLKPVAGAMDTGAMYLTKFSMWWNEIVLYALPVVYGACIGIFVDSSFFFGGIESTSGRVFYAGVVGWFSDFLYEVVQRALYKSTGVQLPDADNSIPPMKPDQNGG